MENTPTALKPLLHLLTYSFFYLAVGIFFGGSDGDLQEGIDFYLTLKFSINKRKHPA